MKLANDFSASDIVFAGIRKNKQGGKFIPLSTAAGPVRIQLPALRAPFGLNPPRDQVKEYYVNLSLTPELEAKFKELDQRAAEYVQQNCVDLMGKTVDLNTLKDILMTPLVKSAKDSKYASTIKLKASRGEGKDLAECYNSLREPVALDEIKSGCTLESIIELTQIWFINGKFGVSARLLQAKLAPSDKLSGYSFVDPVNDEIDIPEDI
jgi:hypothetical protein